jgi:hypothetical protein
LRCLADESFGNDILRALFRGNTDIDVGSERARETRGTDQESGKVRAIIMGVRNLNTGTKRRTKLGLALEQSAKEILAHVKGDVRLPTRRIPPRTSPKRKRK